MAQPASRLHRAPATIEGSVRSVVEGTWVVVHEISDAIAALATAFPLDFSADPADSSSVLPPVRWAFTLSRAIAACWTAAC